MTDAEIKAIERRVNLAKSHGIDQHICPACGGDGVYGLADDEITCPRCRGGKQIRGIVAPQELIEKDVPALLEEISRLRGPFTCAHDPEHVGGACSACHAEALMKIERSAGDTCDCCAGTGKPVSGLPCVCGGTGRGSDEKVGLRKEVARISSALETLQSKLVVGGMPIPGLICLQESYVMRVEAEIKRLKDQHDLRGAEINAMEELLQERNLQIGDARALIQKCLDNFSDDLDGGSMRHSIGRLCAELGAWMEGRRVEVCKHDGERLKTSRPPLEGCKKCGTIWLQPVTEKRNCAAESSDGVEPNQSERRYGNVGPMDL